MQLIFDTVLRMSIQGSVIFLILFAVRFFMGKLHVSHKYLVVLWMVLFFYLVFPWKISLPVGFWQSEVLVEQLTVMNKVTASAPTLAIDDSSETSFITAGSVVMEQTLPILWVVMVTLAMGLFICSYFRLQHRLRLSVPLTDQIYWTEAIQTPMVFGILNPRIYLPLSCSQEDLTYVILHESMHIKRRDFLWKLLAYLICLIHWFNPVIWLAFHLLANDMEKACDEAVLQQLNREQCKEYAHALLQAVTTAYGRKIFVAPLCFGEGNVKGRIRNIVMEKRMRPWKKGFSWGVILVMAVVFVTAVEVGEVVELDSAIVEEEGKKETVEVTVKNVQKLKQYASVGIVMPLNMRQRYMGKFEVMKLADKGSNLTYGDFYQYELSLDNEEGQPKNMKRYVFREKGEWIQIRITWPEDIYLSWGTPLTSAIISRVSTPAISNDMLTGNIARVMAIKKLR